MTKKCTFQTMWKVCYINYRQSEKSGYSKKILMILAVFFFSSDEFKDYFHHFGYALNKAFLL